MLHCDLGVESHNFFQTFAANANFFLRISIPKTLLRCPKLETRFLALPLRPRATAVRGVHRGAFRKQELCDLALAQGCRRRPVERRLASGAFPGPPAAVASGGQQLKRPRPRRRPTLWAAELYSLHPFNRQTNDTRHLVHTVQSKKPFTNTLNKFQCIFLANNLAFDNTTCK